MPTKRRSDKSQPHWADNLPPPEPYYYSHDRACYPPSLLGARLTHSHSRVSSLRSYSHASRMGYDENRPQAEPLAPPDAPAHTREHDDRYGFPNHPEPYKPHYSNIWMYILAIFLPPVPVFLKTGCSIHLLLNVLLWALCWIPGVIHSFYVISQYI